MFLIDIRLQNTDDLSYTMIYGDTFSWKTELSTM